MKRSCNGCKASDGSRCDLGYQTKKEWVGNYGLVSLIPTEKCPKPRTSARWLELKATDARRHDPAPDIQEQDDG